MPRLMFNDEFRSKLEKILLQEAIYNKRNLRMMVEGILIECGLVVRSEICLGHLDAGIPFTKDSMHGR